MAYSAGNLEMSITALSTNAINSLDAVISKLGILDKTLKHITENIGGLQTISNAFSKMGKVSASFDVSNVRNALKTLSRLKLTVNDDQKSFAKYVSDLSRGLSKLSKLPASFAELEKIDFAKLTQRFTQLAQAVTPFLDKINSSSAGLTAFASSMQQINNSTEGKGSKNKNGLFHIGRLTAVYFMARRIGGAVADIVQSGADYTETLNLWTVAMKGYEQKATEFVNKMNEAYGISEKTLMNAQATFKNMLGALGGLTNEMAYGMSEGITKMALDYASLYNVSIDQAMTKFQAALAGQVRPIRSVSGYDITESTLGELYKSMGGTKTIRQLSQTEKRLLSIYAIFKQMDNSGAVGDMKETITSFANQSRVMAEQWEDVKSFAGAIITENLKNLGILQTINTALAFTAEFLKGIATLSGALELDRKVKPWADSLNNANDELEKVKQNLLGFDKFRALDNGEAKDNQGGDIGIDKTISDAISGYGDALNPALLKSKEIARKWLEIVGITYDGEKGATEYTERFEAIKSIIDVIGSALFGVLTALGAKGFLALLPKIASGFGNIGGAIAKAFSPKMLIISAIAGALYYMYTTNEDFRDSVNNLFAVLGGALTSILEPIFAIIGGLAPILADVLTVATEILTPIIDIVAEVIKFLDNTKLLVPVLLAIGAAILLITAYNAVWNAVMMANPIVLIITGIIAAIIALGFAISAIIKNFDAIWAGIKNIIRAVGNFFANIGIGIANIFIDAVNFCVDILNALLTPLDAVIKLFGGQGLQIPHWNVDIQYDPIKEFALGGMPDKGTLFIAGEAGAEIVSTSSSGQTGVSNVQQIAQATYQGTMSALRDWWGGQNARGDIPQLTEANATGMYQAVTGVAKSYGKTWSNV